MLNTNLPNSNTFLEFQATVIETSVFLCVNCQLILFYHKLIHVLTLCSKIYTQSKTSLSFLCIYRH